MQQKRTSATQNLISLRRPRSLSCTDSEDKSIVLQEGKYNNTKERSQSKNFSLSSKSSSGFSSMDLMKNFEKVENWRKNSSRFLDEHKEDEILLDQEMDDTASSQHKLTKSMDEEWSMETTAQKVCDPCAQRMSDLIVNRSDSKAENFIHCIRISDNDNCVKQELNQNSEKYFQIANNKSGAQKYYTKSAEHAIAPNELVNVAPYSCKIESQRSQLSNRTYKLKDSKIFARNNSPRNSLSIEKDHIISDQKYFDNLILKQKVAVPTTKHSELITGKEYLEPYFIHPRNESGEIFVNNNDNSCDINKCQNRQCADMLKSIMSDNRRSRKQNQSFVELPEVNYRDEEVKTSANMMSPCHSLHENTKKSDNILNMDPEKIERFRRESCSTSQHPYNNDKMNHLKNTFISSGKLLRNMGNNLNLERSSCKFAENSADSKKSEWKIEEAKLRKKCLQHRLKPIVHLVPIIRKNEQEAMILSPQKKMTLRKFTDKEPNQYTSNIFINPIYANAGPGMIASGRCSKQSEIIVPQCITPPLYNVSRDNRRNLKSVDALYEHSTIVPPCLPYSGNRRQSRKTLRRFM
ncbi:unnamed protein product [Acanthocheilonema viteae]|uniref:Uncharacterized protein n=1 Tax=Acanthocheilonema viteae TaxID=6277 RepID=A0A498SX57_ACAVI|nr:unnamed protein product [Acanthocheilonema viteae]